jgi:5-methylcytosine-specific restriction protein B
MEYFVNKQGGLFKLAKDKYDLLLDIIREQNPVSTSEIEPKDKYTKDDFLREVYMTSEKYDDIDALLERKKNIILQGAPGVGKSFLAKRLANSIIGYKNTERVEMIQFHQSYSYEDFIEGFRPLESGGFKVLPGVFNRFCEKAKNNEGKHFFIIDEIKAHTVF